MKKVLSWPPSNKGSLTKKLQYRMKEATKAFVASMQSPPEVSANVLAELLQAGEAQRENLLRTIEKLGLSDVKMLSRADDVACRMGWARSVRGFRSDIFIALVAEMQTTRSSLLPEVIAYLMTSPLPKQED